jgi:hypothetical protein
VAVAKLHYLPQAPILIKSRSAFGDHAEHRTLLGQISRRAKVALAVMDVWVVPPSRAR